MNLSEIWGATDKEPEKLVVPYDGYHVKANLLAVHERIVAIQEMLEEGIPPSVLRAHFDVSSGSLNAIYGLDADWYKERPANRVKLATIAEYCRTTQVFAHGRKIAKLMRGQENAKSE